MDLFTITGRVLLNGTDEAQRDIKQVVTDSERGSDRMVSAFKKVGTAVATFFALDKIKDFGVAIVKTSAEVSAEVSSFGQIMGNYSNTAQQKLEQIATKTGAVATRLTPYMTSMTAKFKGLGFDISKSTDLASRGLLLASDASAFWDKTLDESMSHLNSFINGSYEGGEAIGLFANDTQMAQYAIKKGLIATTTEWTKLDEATKQATRLEYAEAMMKASGAVGQASKEAGQLMNVQGNLTETWRQFKAQIGEPLLQNVVIPAMRYLQSVVQVLSDKFGTLQKWIEDNQTTIEKWEDAVIIAVTSVVAFIVTLGALKILTSVVGWIKNAGSAFHALSGILMANPIMLIAGLLVVLGAAFIKAYNSNETFRNAVNNAWNSMLTAIQPVIDALIPIMDKVTDWFKRGWEQVIQPFFSNVWGRLQEFGVNLANSFSDIWVSLQPIFTVIGEIGTLIFSTIANTILPALNSFLGATNTTGQAVDEDLTGMQAVFQTVFAVIDAVLRGIEWTINNVVKPAIDYVATFLTENMDKIKGTISDGLGVITSILNAFSALFKGDWEGVWTYMKEAVDGALNYIKGLIDLAFAFIGGIIDPFLQNLGTSWEEVWNGLSSVITPVMNGIGSLFNALFALFKGDWEGAWNGVKEFFSGIWGGLSVIIETAWNKITLVWDKIKGIFKLNKGDYESEGKNVTEGILQGMQDESTLSKLKTGISNVGTSVKNWFKDVLGIQSPSTETAEMGRFLDEGLIEGLEEGEAGVLAKITSMCESMGEGFKNSALFKRVAKAFGFEIADEISEGIEEGTSTTATTVAEAGEKNVSWFKRVSDKFTATFGDSIKKSKEWATNIGQALNTAVQAYQQYLGGLFDSIQAYNDQLAQNEISALERKLELLKENQDEQLEMEEQRVSDEQRILDKQFKSGAISYSQYIKQKKALDAGLSAFKSKQIKDEENAEKELARKKDELGKKQFEANKKSQIANVWINTATAIMTTFAQLGWIAGGIASAFLLAQAGIQTATINEQQYTPALAEGGTVTKRTIAEIGEDGKEVVLPLEKNTGWMNVLSQAITPSLSNAVVQASQMVGSQRSQALNQESSQSMGAIIGEKMDLMFDTFLDRLDKLVNKDANLIMDTGALVGAIAPEMNRKLGVISAKGRF